MAIVITPPTPLPDAIDAPKVFLAGSIEMDTAENWQSKISDALRETDVVLFNPRRSNWDSSWKQSIRNPFFREQVNWEMDGLEKSDIIVVYFDPNTRSPITLLEVGLHAASGKMLLCCPDGFWRKGNIEIVCERYNIPMFHNFSELLDALQAQLAHWKQ